MSIFLGRYLVLVLVSVFGIFLKIGTSSLPLLLNQVLKNCDPNFLLCSLFYHLRPGFTDSQQR